MQRRLILMRHAKSSWDSGAPTDHARPLNQRGRRDAPNVARRLVELGWRPDTVLSSDAERTRQTFALMAPELGDELEATFARVLYHAGLEAIGEQLGALSPHLRTVLLLGHNPGWERAATALCGEAITLKTANAALLEGSGATWHEALGATGGWRLAQLVVARALAAEE